MARPEKEAAVTEIKERLARAKTVILADYRGLNVSEATELRRQLREAGIEFKVTKNTLTSRAAKEADREDLTAFLTGPTALAFSYDDPVAPVKILAAYAKDHKNLALKGGIVEGKIFDGAQIGALAELPARDQLLAMLAGMMQSPLRGLVTVLSAPMRNLVYGLEALRKQRGAEA